MSDLSQVVDLFSLLLLLLLAKITKGIVGRVRRAVVSGHALSRDAVLEADGGRGLNTLLEVVGGGYLLDEDFDHLVLLLF